MNKYPKNPFAYGSQNYRIYDRLTMGALTGLDISRMGILAHTRRVADIREALAPLGWTIETKMISSEPRIFQYRLVEVLPLWQTSHKEDRVWES